MKVLCYDPKFEDQHVANRKTLLPDPKNTTGTEFDTTFEWSRVIGSIEQDKETGGVTIYTGDWYIVLDESEIVDLLAVLLKENMHPEPGAGRIA